MSHQGPQFAIPGGDTHLCPKGDWKLVELEKFAGSQILMSEVTSCSLVAQVIHIFPVMSQTHRASLCKLLFQLTPKMRKYSPLHLYIQFFLHSNKPLPSEPTAAHIVATLLRYLRVSVILFIRPGGQKGLRTNSDSLGKTERHQKSQFN